MSSDTLEVLLDNTGEHGTDECVAHYTEILRDEFNIIIIHQVPHSLYCNTLDLGVWCSLQVHVEKYQYMKRCNVENLVRSVYHTWNCGNLNNVISKVFGCLEKVMFLINEG